jgi:hypothetical protein
MGAATRARVVAATSLCAVCGLIVWMVMVTGVGSLPAGIVAGEKVAVAPAGKPVALKASASG